MAEVHKKDRVVEEVVVDPGGVTLDLSLEEAAYLTGVLGRGNASIGPEGTSLYNDLMNVLSPWSTDYRTPFRARATAYGNAHDKFVRTYSEPGALGEIKTTLKKKLAQAGELQ